MPRNGSGTYTLPQAAFTPGTTISSSAVNSDLSDIAAQITNSLAADGQTIMTGQVKGVAGSSAAPSYTWGSALTTGFFLTGGGNIGIAVGGTQVGQFSSSGLVTGGTGVPNTVPIGAVTSHAGSTAPTGWLLCFGQAVSRTTYAALFAIISTTFGSGDGVTTFNLPDCRGRASYGQDNMGGSAANRITVAGGNFDGTVLGGTGGAQNHTLTSPGELPSHTHGTTENPHNHSYTSFDTNDASSGLAINAGSKANTTGNATTGLSVNATGTGNPHTILNPAIIFNTIIYAGA